MADKGLVTVPVQARIVRGVVGQPSQAEHWCLPFVGQQRMLIECVIKAKGMPATEPFYLDAQGDPQILWKITYGEGRPDLGGIRQLPVTELIDDPTIHAFYRVDYAGNEGRQGKFRVVHGSS